MQRLLSTTALLGVLAISPAMAGVGFMAGIQYDFGKGSFDQSFGITAKALTSNRPNQFVGAAGATFFPFADSKFGIDADVGYTFDNGAVLGGYDFLNNSVDVAGGWADTKKHHHPVMISDRRLKRDVTLLATLANGLKIYSFRYKWSEDLYVGVMAQDLPANRAWRSAVVTRADGFYAVDYAKLGLKMCLLKDWQKHGLQAIEDASVPFAVAA